MRSLAPNSPPVQIQPLPIPSTPQVDDDPPEDPTDSVKPGSMKGAETTDTHDTSDDDGSTEYYTDQPPDSPLERSPSPPVHPLAKNHSYEGHSDRGEGPSSQSSQSTQKPKVQSSDEESEDGRTPKAKGKSRQRKRDDTVPKPSKRGSDEELEVLRSEFSSQIVLSPPPRKLKPDPYAGWSPTKRNIMVFMRSKPPGEEVNIKRVPAEGTSKLEMRNAIKELVREGEIETVDGINYRLTDRGPKYPRF